MNAETFILVVFLLLSIVAVSVFWLCTTQPEELVGVQVIYEDREWRVYGFQRDGGKILIDAFASEAPALACALKVAAKHHAIQHMQQVSFDAQGMQLGLHAGPKHASSCSEGKEADPE